MHLLESWSVSSGLDLKALQHYDNADFRLRVGDYRVLLNKDDERQEIYLLRVLHRSKLY
jgi:mRNA-degrading endonuclease RelE of RelBE toxin-antitoxin system